MARGQTCNHHSACSECSTPFLRHHSPTPGSQSGRHQAADNTQSLSDTFEHLRKGRLVGEPVSHRPVGSPMTPPGSVSQISVAASCMHMKQQKHQVPKAHPAQHLRMIIVIAVKRATLAPFTRPLGGRPVLPPRSLCQTRNAVQEVLVQLHVSKQHTERCRGAVPLIA
jgi:hypothetical protein